MGQGRAGCGGGVEELIIWIISNWLNKWYIENIYIFM